MSDELSHDCGLPALSGLSAATMERLDSACLRFETGWKQGPRPVLEEYLSTVPEPEALTLLFELLKLDLYYRRQAGETIVLADYVPRFPQYRQQLEQFAARASADDSVAPGPGRAGPAAVTPGTDPEITGPFRTLAEPLPPPCIPGYEILGELGQGGMGVVYCCRDVALERQLAVKVVHEHHKGDTKLKRRFLEEAKIMGRLQHPGIAPIHEIGSLGDGRPFFSMKQVQGRTLAEILKKERGAADQGRKGAGDKDSPGQPANELPRLLNIFEQVCQALAFAHGQSILHRDLKPGNIMVGAFGEVQVMDWGLAKELQIADCGLQIEKDGECASASSSANLQSSQTQAGQVLGTPPYMAPEQARGEIDQLDERSDVFGLGAILCQILTGEPPYAGRDRNAIQRHAMQAELTGAFNRLDSSSAAPELITLAKRCLQPKKEDRPRDAAAVAQAVTSYLELVQERLRQAEVQRAAAEAKAQEEQKRRHVEQAKVREERRRRRAQLAFSISLVLLVVGASAAGFWYVNDQAQRKAEQIRLEEKQTQEKQERVNQESLRQADVATRKQYRAKEMTAALDQTETLHNNLHQQLGDPVKVHVLLSDIDSWDRMVRAARAAWQEAKTLAGTSKEPLAAALLARLHGLDLLLKADAADYELAHEQDNLRLKATILIEEHFDSSSAADKEYAKFFGRLQYAFPQGDPVEVAAQINQSSLRFVLVTALDDWVHVTSNRKLGLALLQVAKRVDPDLWRAQVRDAVARKDQRQLLELAKKAKLGEQSPQILRLLALNLPEKKNAAELLRQALVHHPGDFWLHFYLGGLLNDPAEQAGCFRAALAIRQTSSLAYYNLGVVLKKQKDMPGAVDACHKAIHFDPKNALAYNVLGTALRAQGDLRGAVDAYNKAIELNPDAHTYFNLGNTLKAQKDLRGAVDAYNKATRINDQYAEAYINLGIALYDQRDFAGAVIAYNKAIKIKPGFAEPYNNLGNALQAQRKLPEAVDAYNKAIKINDQYAEAYINLGIALQAQGNLTGALAACNKAIEINQAQGNLPGTLAACNKAIEINPRHAEAYNSLGVTLNKQGNLPGAVAAYKMAVKFNSKYALAYYNLGLALYAQEDLPGAVAALKEASTINSQDARAQGALGYVLLAQGEFAGAKQATLQALKLAPANHPMHNVVQSQLQQCEQLLAVDRKVSAIRQGETPPGTAAEQLQLAAFCQKYKKYQAAASLYAGAFAKEPALVRQPGQLHRFNAACAAALGAAGKGNDAGKLAEPDKAKLRQQALAWLKDELAAQDKLLQVNRRAAAQVQKKLEHWQSAAALAGVRDAKASAQLPQAERQDWQQLWADVDTLLKKTRQPQ